jgi:hypothetical protein
VIHEEVLPEEQRACLRTLGPAATALGFHLAGGPARLASCEDLAAMKLLAVTQRGTKKDFVDVHALSRLLPLEIMLDCFRSRFAVSDTARVLAGLCYFDSAEEEPMPTMLVPINWEVVKSDLRHMVRDVVDGS